MGNFLISALFLSVILQKQQNGGILLSRTIEVKEKV